MTAKDDLHDLVEGLDETEAAMWLDFLSTGDPLLRSLLMAPYDDEPETDEERAASARAHEDYRLGKWKTSAEVREFFGLMR
jgi:hypothetical protein